MKNFIKKCCKITGPGVITGAADNDPSGIATYSQTGAQFGYAQLWLALFLLPLQTAIQEACARLGAVTGHGIAALIKTHYGNWFSHPLIFLLLIANIINIGADIGAMAAVVQLLIPANFILLTIFFAISILILEIFVTYQKYANLLKWLCLSLLAYPITVFIIHAPWLKVLTATFVPKIEFNFQFLFIVTGIIGTTISPYLFFWQASQEVEEVNIKGLKRNNKPKITDKFIKLMRIDNFFGMLFSQICAWSIIVVAATVLNPNGITDINTAADAAKALQPFVGPFAVVIFAVGIIGLGLLSVPILAGSAAYACCEIFDWKFGLNLKFKSAPYFYLVIIIATCIGLLMGFSGINPMKALVYAAVINGIVAIPLIFVIALLANNKKIMGKHKSGKLSNLFLMITFICMLICALSLLFTLKIN